MEQFAPKINACIDLVLFCFLAWDIISDARGFLNIANYIYIIYVVAQLVFIIINRKRFLEKAQELTVLKQYGMILKFVSLSLGLIMAVIDIF